MYVYIIFSFISFSPPLPKYKVQPICYVSKLTSHYPSPPSQSQFQVTAVLGALPFWAIPGDRAISENMDLKRCPN